MATFFFDRHFILSLAGHTCLLLMITAGLLVSPAVSDAKQTEGPGYFFEIEGAKDCAFDESKQRLYVCLLYTSDAADE